MRWLTLVEEIVVVTEKLPFKDCMELNEIKCLLMTGLIDAGSSF
jgi:hypothetical protein